MLLARPTGFGLVNPFETWWWRHRKLIVLGGAGILGLGLLAIVGRVLR